jgi:hypothetical protein
MGTGQETAVEQPRWRPRLGAEGAEYQTQLPPAPVRMELEVVMNIRPRPGAAGRVAPGHETSSQMR